MPHNILQTDWSDYEARKRSSGHDNGKFDCVERWEREYLAEKIGRIYPYHSREEIRKAIDHCCAFTVNEDRNDFVSRVMSRLKL